MDRLTIAASFAGTVALLVIGEAFDLHDRLFPDHSPAGELRRFLAAHPDATVHDLRRHT